MANHPDRKAHQFEPRVQPLQLPPTFVPLRNEWTSYGPTWGS